MTGEDHVRVSEDLAAFALGALEPDEALRVSATSRRAGSAAPTPIACAPPST